MPSKILLTILITLSLFVGHLSASDDGFSIEIIDGKGEINSWEDTRFEVLIFKFKIHSTDPSQKFTASAACMTSNNHLDAIVELKNREGLVRLKEKLMMKNNDAFITTLVVTSSSKNKEEKVFSRIKPINKNPPVFTKVYNQPIRLAENNRLENISIATLVAEDPDILRGDEMKVLDFDFRIIGNDNDKILEKFMLNCTHLDGTDKYVCQVLLKQPLDYEDMNLYRLKIVVKDTSENRTNAIPRKEAETTLTIEVEDVHDQPPSFTVECGFQKIDEHTNATSIIKRVKAVDRDIRVNSDITYSIVTNKDDEELKKIKEYFEVDYEGNLKVKSDIDRDIPELRDDSTIIFYIQANEINSETGKTETENGTATSNCMISINDIDDQRPKFNKREYLAKIEEHSKGDVIFEEDDQYIEDIDLGDNAKFRVMLFNDTFPDMFEIKPKEGGNRAPFSISVKNNTHLEYDSDILGTSNKEVRLKLISEGKLNAYHKDEALVIVKVIDINDNKPVFEEIGNVSVYENVTEGFIVIKINATDIDSGNFGTEGIEYYIKSGVEDANWSINYKTGEITVKKDHGIDREKKSEHSIVVSAVDDCGKGQVETKELKITILDVNDNIPEFTTANDECFPVNELQQPPWTFGTPLSAKDLDIGNNSLLEFFIVDGNEEGYFEVKTFENKYASIILANSVANVTIKGNNPKLNITFMVKDLGDPPLNSTKVYCIEVLDENNHAPVFDPTGTVPDPSKPLTIDEATEGYPTVDKVVMTKIRAEDLDLGEDNGKVSYDIVKGNELNYFTIRTVAGGTGNLIVREDLKKVWDPENQHRNSFKLEIGAKDGGTPSLRAEKNLKINIIIKGTQESILTFPNKIDMINFTEHSTPGKEIRQIPEAFYKEFVEEEEKQQKIRYFVTGGKDKDSFSLNEETGSLTVTKDLDREVQDVLHIIVQAVSDKGIGGTNNNTIRDDVVELKIGLTDINDHYPVFTKAAFTGGVLNNVNVRNTTVVTVLAKDKDEGENARVSYFFVGKTVTIEDGENLEDSNIDNFFALDEKTGNITIVFSPAKNMKGFFKFKVKANDPYGGNDTADVMIYLRRGDQQVILLIEERYSNVNEETLRSFADIVGNAINHYCNVDNWSSYSGSDQFKKDFTEVTTHFVSKSTNKVIETSEALRLINDNSPKILEATKNNFKLVEVTKSEASFEENGWTDQHIMYVLIAATGFLLLSLVVAIFLFLFRISSLKRNLKAASVGTIDMEKNAIGVIGGVSAPNTNLHTGEGSNPMFEQQNNTKLQSEPYCDNISLDSSFDNESSDENSTIEEENTNKSQIDNPLFVDDNGSLAGSHSSSNASTEPVARLVKKFDTISNLKQANKEWMQRRTDHSAPEMRPRPAANPAILSLFDDHNKNKYSAEDSDL